MHFDSKGDTWDMGREIFGYTRVSTKEQHLERGIQEIITFCTEHDLKIDVDRNIKTDKQTGKDFKRSGYISLKECVRKDDIVIIPEYDRLGRADETARELAYFKEKGVDVIFLDIPTTYLFLEKGNDSGMMKTIYSFINDTLISVFQLLATTELDRKQKRQAEGIAQKRLSDSWDDYGRPRKLSKEEFFERYKNVEDGVTTNAQLFSELKNRMSQATYYRYVREYRNERQSNSIK